MSPRETIHSIISHQPRRGHGSLGKLLVSGSCAEVIFFSGRHSHRDRKMLLARKQLDNFLKYVTIWNRQMRVADASDGRWMPATKMRCAALLRVQHVAW